MLQCPIENHIMWRRPSVKRTFFLLFFLLLLISKQSAIALSHMQKSVERSNIVFAFVIRF